MEGKKEEATSSESKPRHEQLMKDTACTGVLARVTSLSRAAAAAARPRPLQHERESTEPLLRSWIQISKGCALTWWLHMERYDRCRTWKDMKVSRLVDLRYSRYSKNLLCMEY